MSKAAWAGLLLMGAGLGLVGYLLTAGLPDDARLVGEAAKKTATKNTAVIEVANKEFAEIVKTEEQMLSAVPEISQGRAMIEGRKTKFTKDSSPLVTRLDAILESDSHQDADELRRVAADLTRVSNEAINGIRAPIATAQRFVGFKTNFTALLKTARDDLTAARAFSNAFAAAPKVKVDPTGVSSEVQVRSDPVADSFRAAVVAYPEARETLDKRLVTATRQASQLLTSGAQLAARAGIDPPDYVGVGRLADAISKGAAALRKLDADLRRDIGQLPISVDKILTDMKSESGRYYHKYRMVENGKARETGWIEVTSSVYQRHRDHLGMTIFSKPEGKLEAEALRTASPPGYNYVGNTRYGRWENRGGTSFWMFYGRYALMRDVLWGRGHYRPVRRGVFQSYRTSRRSGRAWYGLKNQYGTKGTTTRVRYAASKHYTQQRTRRYSSGGSGGGSRSGGSRRGRYRSSSFGGSGK